MMDVLLSIQNTALGTWIRESESFWALPGILLMHTIGMGVLVGSAWVVDLSVLGIVRGIPLEPLRPFFRVMWLGFWLNAVTGTLLYVSEAATKGTSTVFMTKMVFVALGVATVVLVKRNLYDRETGAAMVTSRTRLVAVASMVVWIVAITAGRLLGYLVMKGNP
jgi:hypothetical protein